MLPHIKSIWASKSRKLVGKRIILAISGSIGAVECVKLARELIRHGAEVHAVMSRNAIEIIGPKAMEFATGNPVVTEITGMIEHVTLAESSDLLLIYPATANTIGKIACGIDDTPVTTVVTTAFTRVPILIAPAMHSSMYGHPIVKDNMEKLKKLGVEFIEPKLEEGKAKVPDIYYTVYRVIKALHRKDMRGKRVLVTAGATREYIDPIRFISNGSSGKMGVALAEEAELRGAEVTLIRTRGSVESFVNRQIEVETVEEMLEAVEWELKNRHYDVVVLAAAVNDFRAKSPAKEKIRSGRGITLELEPTPKIIKRVKELQPYVFLVGFKAESERKGLVERAREQMKNAGSDIVVVNTKEAFGADESSVIIVSKEGSKEVQRMSKRELAETIWDEILRLMDRKESRRNRARFRVRKKDIDAGDIAHKDEEEGIAHI